MKSFRKSKQNRKSRKSRKSRKNRKGGGLDTQSYSNANTLNTYISSKGKTCRIRDEGLANIVIGCNTGEKLVTSRNQTNGAIANLLLNPKPVAVATGETRLDKLRREQKEEEEKSMAEYAASQNRRRY